MRFSRHIIFAVIFSFASLLAAGCGQGIQPNSPPDAGPEAPPDASGAVDAASPADAGLPTDALPDNGTPDAIPGPPVGTCVPSDAIAPPGSGECLPPADNGRFHVLPHIDGWYDGRFIAEATCSIFEVDTASTMSFLIHMDCIQHAGDPFETFLPLVILIHSDTRVLPPRLLAGERFALRLANTSWDSAGLEEFWLTMRDEVDGSLLFSLSIGRSLVPDQERLDRLSLTAADWLAPIVVDTVRGVCPTVPFYDGTAERAALDITVPGQEPVRLVDRYTAYLGDTYFVEMGTLATVSTIEDGFEQPIEELMLAAIDVCAE